MSRPHCSSQTHAQWCRLPSTWMQQSTTHLHSDWVLTIVIITIISIIIREAEAEGASCGWVEATGRLGSVWIWCRITGGKHVESHWPSFSSPTQQNNIKSAPGSDKTPQSSKKLSLRRENSSLQSLCAACCLRQVFNDTTSPLLLGIVFFCAPFPPLCIYLLEAIMSVYDS